jgi:hypothetical protein
LALDEMERLRRLAINDARDMELGGGGEVDAPRLDSKPWNSCGSLRWSLSVVLCRPTESLGRCRGECGRDVG